MTGSKSSAPGGTRRSMRIAAIAGPVFGALCIVLGALQFGRGHGIALLTLGCVLSVFWIIMIPVARGRGKL